MANELLEFNAQAEFDFKMSSFAERGQKQELENDCRQAVEHAKSSFKEICLLALQLNEIKQKGHWKHVINPKTGTAFFNTTFDEFTNYAFGLSKTQTSISFTDAKRYRDLCPNFSLSHRKTLHLAFFSISSRR